jgi:hypothetical protein
MTRLSTLQTSTDTRVAVSMMQSTMQTNEIISMGSMIILHEG